MRPLRRRLLLAIIAIGAGWQSRRRWLDAAGPSVVMSGHTVYRCEYVPEHVTQTLFPDYRQLPYSARVMGATERDLLFYGWGPCGQAEHQCGAEHQTDNPCVIRFPGKIVYVNGERGDYGGRAQAVARLPHAFYLGPILAAGDGGGGVGGGGVGGGASGAEMNFSAATHLAVMPALYRLGRELTTKSTLAERGGSRERSGFVVYAASNCVGHREAAFDALVALAQRLRRRGGVAGRRQTATAREGGDDGLLPTAVGKCHGAHPELAARGMPGRHRYPEVCTFHNYTMVLYYIPSVYLNKDAWRLTRWS